MTIISGLAVYFIIWWLTLFMVLPWGAKSPHEAGELPVGGNAPSAPIQAHIKVKLLVTTLLATGFFGLFYWLVPAGNMSLNDLWFLPDFTPKL